MPAFVDALSDDEIDRVIEYVRTFCREPGWPRGDLNFPLAFFTEKAYPENEALLFVDVSASHPQAIESTFRYEHRIGRRGQYEVNVPFNLQQDRSRAWSRGLGDVNVAYKHTVFDSLRRGSDPQRWRRAHFPHRERERRARRRRHDFRSLRAVRPGAAE
jgi:hypothetical protein